VHKGLLPNGILNALLSNPTTVHKGIHNLMRFAHRASDLIFILESSDELPSLTSSAPNCGGTYVYNKNLGKSLYKICVLSFRQGEIQNNMVVNIAYERIKVVQFQGALETSFGYSYH